MFDDESATKGDCEPVSTMLALVAKDEKNAERIFPYIGGEEVFTSPTQAYHRYVIDFGNFPLWRDPDVTG